MANLNEMTNEQLVVYRDNIARILSIDALMLDFIWMDDPESGLKNRVLYAKRGAAEVLRKQLGISVIGLVPYESQGWLMFTATGTDKTGRQEMAVGAAYIEGHKADKRAHVVMTAQTRAVRRLTMQFVTGGVLDETEVQAQTLLSTAPAASQAQLIGSAAVIPPPQVPISVAPGKDITLAPEFDKNGPPNVRPTVEKPILPVENAPLIDQKLNIAQVYEEGMKALADMKPATERSSQLLNPSNIETSAIKEVDINADIKKRGRPRKQRNTVDLASPNQQTEMPVGQIDADGNITIPVITNATISVPPATAKEPEQAVIGNQKVLAPALAELVSPQPSVLAVVERTLPPEKTKEYRDRLNKYSADILPKAGMTPTENIGGCTMKLRRFAQLHTGGEAAKLTEEQFEDLLGFLDTYTQQNGAAALVGYINQAIGVK